MTFWIGAVRMMAGYGHFLYTLDYFLYTLTSLRCTTWNRIDWHNRLQEAVWGRLLVFLLFQVPVLKRDLEQAV